MRDYKQKYRRNLELHQNYNKERYNRQLQLHPNYVQDEYQRQLQLHPNHAQTKYGRVLELHPNHQKDAYKRRLELHPNISKFRVTFLGMRISLLFNPLFDSCVKCKRTVASGEIKRTHLHHDKYDLNDPLAYTRELCVRCHSNFHKNRRVVPIIRGENRS